jgi:hypothetical protein
MIMGGQGCGCILLVAIAGECLLVETASFLPDEGFCPVGRKGVEYDDLICNSPGGTDATADVLFLVMGDDHD